MDAAQSALPIAPGVFAGRKPQAESLRGRTAMDGGCLSVWSFRQSENSKPKIRKDADFGRFL
jgi:hypothetical protein